MKTSLPLLLSLLTLSLTLPQCSVVPDTGRRQLMSTSSEQETQLGLQAFQEYKAKKPVVHNSALAQRVRRIGQQLAAVAEVPGAQWEFVLFQDNEPNAFALPGGKVGVNTGIMSIARNDAGLATIIAHEIAHLRARHAGERLSQTRIAQVGTGLLGAVFPEANTLQTGAGVAAQLGLLRFSREHELEADQIGTLLMARAGYDPREAIAFWTRFAEAKRTAGSGSQPEFLSTHPVDERRIEALQAFMPQALALYRS